MTDTLFPSDVGTFLKDYGSTISILVIGEGGSGRSTLVNNLLGEEPPEEISLLSSLQTHASIVTRQSREYPVIVHEATGEVQYNDADQEYFKTVRSFVQDEKTAVVLCFKLSESRMRSSLTKFIREHDKAEINWKKVVIALTFADSIPVPRSVNQRQNWDKEKFLNDHVKMWSGEIRSMLVTKVGIPKEIVQCIPMAPTQSLREDDLDNHMKWYKEFWQCLISVVKTDQFVTIANENKASKAPAQLLTSSSDAGAHRAVKSSGDNGANDVEEDTQTVTEAAEPTVRLLNNRSASYSSTASAAKHENSQQFSGSYHSAPPGNVDAKTEDTSSSCCKRKCCNIL